MTEARSQQRLPRLLAIDDSPMIHRLLKARLKSERIEIHSASSGPQGFETACSLLPEVILLDIDMPEMDGFKVLERLKSDPRTHDIPVIFLSGTCSTDAKIRGLEMGAVDFVTKPFDIGELKARVRSALRIRLLIQMLAQRAQIDGLTGLWNRAYFDKRLQDEFAMARRHDHPLSLIMCDLDDFKGVNDTYGHPFGDQVLEEFARMLSQGRPGDVACRYGGEEFAVILPRADADEAAGVADRFGGALRRHVWPNDENLVITASFGVCDLERIDPCDPAALLHAADQALYNAKNAGRDQVVLASMPPRTVRRIA